MSIVHVAFYPSDFMAGTRGMTAEETGVYITLICRMYEVAGPIERDDKRLSLLCGCKTKNAFAKVLDYLISENKIFERDGFLINKRVEKEIKNVFEKSEKARRAAEAKWKEKSNKNNEGSDADASPEHTPEHPPSICQPEPVVISTVSSLRSDTDGEAVEDATEIIWTKCKDWLVSEQVPDRQARSLIGKWLKDNSPGDVRAAFVAAWNAKTRDPVPYITEILKPEPQIDVAALVSDAVRNLKVAN